MSPRRVYSEFYFSILDTVGGTDELSSISSFFWLLSFFISGKKIGSLRMGLPEEEIGSFWSTKWKREPPSLRVGENMLTRGLTLLMMLGSALILGVRALKFSLLPW